MHRTISRKQEWGVAARRYDVGGLQEGRANSGAGHHAPCAVDILAVHAFIGVIRQMAHARRT